MQCNGVQEVWPNTLDCILEISSSTRTLCKDGCVEERCRKNSQVHQFLVPNMKILYCTYHKCIYIYESVYIYIYMHVLGVGDYLSPLPALRPVDVEGWQVSSRGCGVPGEWEVTATCETGAKYIARYFVCVAGNKTSSVIQCMPPHLKCIYLYISLLKKHSASVGQVGDWKI